MLNVFFAGRLRLGVVVRVVIAIGQSQSTLHHLRDNLGRVFEVLAGAKAKDGRNAVRVQAGYFIFQAQQVGDLSDPLEFGLQWSDAFGLDLLLVHARAVKIRDLLFVAVGELLFRDQAVKDSVQDIRVLFFKQLETPPTRIGRRDLVLIHPSAIGKTIEILTGAGAAIDTGKIETRQRRIFAEYRRILRSALAQLKQRGFAGQW